MEFAVLTPCSQGCNVSCHCQDKHRISRGIGPRQRPALTLVPAALEWMGQCNALLLLCWLTEVTRNSVPGEQWPLQKRYASKSEGGERFCTVLPPKHPQNTIQKLIFLQIWHGTKKYSFTFPADRAVWHHAESGVSLILKPKRFLGFPKSVQERIQTHLAHAEELQATLFVFGCMLKASTWKDLALLPSPSLPLYFFPWTLIFPSAISRLNAPRGRVGPCSAKHASFHLLFPRMRGKCSLSKYNTLLQTVHLPSRVEKERNLVKTWLAKRKEAKIC